MHSKVIPLYMYACLYFTRLFSIVSYYKMLNIVPCAIQYVLAVHLHISYYSLIFISSFFNFEFIFNQKQIALQNCAIPSFYENLCDYIGPTQKI